MTKIFKPVCLMVALALVLALGATIVPAGPALAQGIGITITGADTTTTEASGTDTFDVVLTGGPPGADVTITLTSSDTMEGDVTTPASQTLTFTTANWDTAQTVTVTGADDFVDDGDIAYSIDLLSSSTDATFSGLTESVSVTNTDDDTRGITVTITGADTTTTEAGGTDIFDVVLDSEPTADVTITLTSSDTTEGDVTTPASQTLTFTTANWDTAQTVTVTGADDFVDDGDIVYSIDLAASGGDYGTETASVSVTNTNDDTAAVTVTPTSGLVTDEAGGTDTFDVVLDSEPTADVTIGLSSSDTTEGTVSPASLTFTSANWDTAQTVTVTGVDDDVTDGDIVYTIDTAASSTDAKYDGIAVADVSVTNEDVPIEADFTASTATKGEAPLTVQFRDRSLHDNEYDTDWLWSFGDGETSTSRSPSHVYQYEGLYTVSLRVTNEGGSDYKTRVDYITVEAGGAAPNLVIRDVNTTPVYAKPRQAIGITAKVVNEGGTWGSDTVELMINEAFEQSVDVGVAPGTAQPISFTVYKVEAGEYKVRIGDATGTFYVMEEEEPAAQRPVGLLAGGELDTGGIIAIIVIGIILVGGIVFALLLARRA